jgi:hypothetical protein
MACLPKSRLDTVGAVVPAGRMQGGDKTPGGAIL